MRSNLSDELGEFGENESQSQGRGDSRSAWSQRRQAKQRTRAKAKRGQASVTAQKGIHMRRNKRMGW